MVRPLLVLPEEMQAELRRLLGLDDKSILGAYVSAVASAGWGYQAAARVLGMPRQDVRQIAQQADGDMLSAEQRNTVSSLPQKTVTSKRAVITNDEADRLRQLHEQARHLRPEHARDDPRRRASEELSLFIHTLTQRGVWYRQVGGVLGIKPNSVRERLKRHGYRDTPPSSRPYRGFRPSE